MKRLALFLLFVVLMSQSEGLAQWSELPAPDMRWRMIGPHRGGRTVATAGIASQPNVFFIGVNNGGVWKTDDYGRTWRPIFDDQATGSIGALALAPSNPDVIYVGSGEGLHRPDLSVGDGMFKSLDGGETWQHIGLSDAQQIGGVAVDPRDPNRVFVAVLGHPYGPNEQRGVFVTTDGGATWAKSLYIDERTGAIQVVFDPQDPEVLYADMWSHQEGPWENAVWSGATSGLYKSMDGGVNWTRLSGGLPGADQGLGRIGIGISPSHPQRIYATVNANEGGGIYRSDDAGGTWRMVSDDHRLWGRGDDFAEIKVHPHDPDLVFVANIASYRSADGGASWMSLKGAPGGDDYHGIWINPDNPDIMLFAADQGATITVNGGKTWSSWYNQPTAQLYHVSTDNQFPYFVYGGQQESGAIAVSSRGNGGQISFRDWHGVGADEYAYVAPDPLDPNIVYGGRVTRFDRRTGQTQFVAPEVLRSGKYRVLRTMPLMFAPTDPKTLYFATNVLFKTQNGGESWTVISPDLSREHPDVPASFAVYGSSEAPRRGVIYALAPSFLDGNVIWAGTDDGLIHITRDGGSSWRDVTPPEITSWSKISQIDAGHFSDSTAYVAVNRIRVDDMKPYVYRTHDGGKTWDLIVDGLPEFGPVNVVREDPERAGLLLAGTETAVFVSIDDGDSWHPLRLNMAPSSIRDLVIHGDDVVAGTHGRSIWILDNISPLRQYATLAYDGGHFLFEPQTATRVRWNMFSDTPLPPEEPTGENPPDGAVFDYFLKSKASKVSLEIVDADGAVVRRFSSDDRPEVVDTTSLPHPTYWIGTQKLLSTEAGMHRFVWDMRYAPPPDVPRSFSIAAVAGRTPSGPHGPWVKPGSYRLRMLIDDVTFEREFSVALDPRVSATETDIDAQNRAAMEAYSAYHEISDVRRSVHTVRTWAEDFQADPAYGEFSSDLSDFLSEVASIEGTTELETPSVHYSAIYAADGAGESLSGLQQKFLFVLAVVDEVDATPTSQTLDAIRVLQDAKATVFSRWSAVRESTLVRLNERFARAGLQTIVAE